MFGPHLTLEGYGCKNINNLSDPDIIKKALLDLPSLVDMHIIMQPKIMFYDGGEIPEDKGVSGFVIIAESHIAIHTFHEKKFFTFDMFSCKDFDVTPVINFIQEIFAPEKLEKTLFQRGREFPRSEVKAKEIISSERLIVAPV